MYGSVDGIKANVPNVSEEIIIQAKTIVHVRQSSELPKRFLEIIQAPVTDAEKAEIGAYCQKYGTDTPTVFRLYRVFKALQS